MKIHLGSDLLADTYVELRRQLRTALAGFTLTFLACCGVWTWGEADYPWQQYADPVLPCLFIACLGAQAALILHLLADIAVGTFRLLARRRRNR